jgi:hypothetical protein
MAPLVVREKSKAIAEREIGRQVGQIDKWGCVGYGDKYVTMGCGHCQSF